MISNQVTKKIAYAMTLVASGITSTAAIAQQGPPIQPPQLRTDNPVQSANRTLFSSVAKTSKSPVFAGQNSATGVLVVDSTGKTLGRSMGGSGVLLSYNNQLMQTFLGWDFDYQTQKFNSGGFNWAFSHSPNSQYGVTFYDSPECIGIPYSFFSVVGTPYAGVAVTDTWPPTATSTYLLVLDSAHPVMLNIRSYFSAGQCYSFPDLNWTTFVMPTIGAVPLSSLGTPPFYLK